MPHFHPAMWEDTAKTLRIKLVGKVRQCLWVWLGVWSQHHELVTQACSFLFCSADCFWYCHMEGGKEVFYGHMN